MNQKEEYETVEWCALNAYTDKCFLNMMVSILNMKVLIYNTNYFFVIREI